MMTFHTQIIARTSCSLFIALFLWGCGSSRTSPQANPEDFPDNPPSDEVPRAMVRRCALWSEYEPSLEETKNLQVRIQDALNSLPSEHPAVALYLGACGKRYFDPDIGFQLPEAMLAIKPGYRTDLEKKDLEIIKDKASYLSGTGRGWVPEYWVEWDLAEADAYGAYSMALFRALQSPDPKCKQVLYANMSKRWKDTPKAVAFMYALKQLQLGTLNNIEKYLWEDVEFPDELIYGQAWEQDYGILVMGLDFEKNIQFQPNESLKLTPTEDLYRRLIDEYPETRSAASAGVMLAEHLWAKGETAVALPLYIGAIAHKAADEPTKAVAGLRMATHILEQGRPNDALKVLEAIPPLPLENDARDAMCAAVLQFVEKLDTDPAPDLSNTERHHLTFFGPPSTRGHAAQLQVWHH